MRIPFWIPRTPVGVALSAIIGLAVAALVAYLVFDGRPIAEIQCTDAACFRSRTLEGATTAAAGLLVGSLLGTRLETRWLYVKNRRLLKAALATEPDFYGRSTRVVAALLDDLPRVVTPEKLSAMQAAAGLPDERDMRSKAFRSSFATGEAMALQLYLERAELATDMRLAQVAGLAAGPIVECTRRAVALLVCQDYLSPSDIRRAWGPFAELFGALPAAGPTEWVDSAQMTRANGNSRNPAAESLAARLGEAWGRWRAGRR